MYAKYKIYIIYTRNAISQSMPIKFHGKTFHTLGKYIHSTSSTKNLITPQIKNVTGKNEINFKRIIRQRNLSNGILYQLNKNNASERLKTAFKRTTANNAKQRKNINQHKTILKSKASREKPTKGNGESPFR